MDRDLLLTGLKRILHCLIRCSSLHKTSSTSSAFGATIVMSSINTRSGGKLVPGLTSLLLPLIQIPESPSPWPAQPEAVRLHTQLECRHPGTATQLWNSGLKILCQTYGSTPERPSAVYRVPSNPASHTQLQSGVLTHTHSLNQAIPLPNHAFYSLHPGSRSKSYRHPGKPGTPALCTEVMINPLSSRNLVNRFASTQK